MKKELTCISCPNGCILEVDLESGRVVSIKGNECKKGVEYAKNEILQPVRIVTTTVKISGAQIPFLPVKTSKPVKKELCRKIVEKASGIEVKAPIKLGEVIARNILDTGTDLVATRSIK
jgi:CxxC motif-containing protein